MNEDRNRTAAVPHCPGLCRTFSHFGGTRCAAHVRIGEAMVTESVLWILGGSREFAFKPGKSHVMSNWLRLADLGGELLKRYRHCSWPMQCKVVTNV